MFTEINTLAPGIVAPVANRVEQSQLINGVRTYTIEVRVRATLTLAGGPATAILNGGSVLSLFSRSGILENGTRTVDADVRSLGILSQMQSPRVIDAGRAVATNVANGAYPLEETFFLYFSTPLGIGPSETTYIERVVRNALYVFIMQNTNGLNAIVQSPGTAVISAVTVDVLQRFDTDRAERTAFLPVIRTYEFPVAGAAQELPMKIETSNYIRALLVQQDTAGAGAVNNVINSLALRADGKDIIGPSLVPYAQLQAQAQTNFAGDLGLTLGYLPLWFQAGGRLSNLLNPNAMLNLRFVANVQPSVTVGAGASTIRVTSIELQRVPGITRDSLGFDV